MWKNVDVPKNRKRFFFSLNQNLNYVVPSELNGEPVAAPPPAIFEKGETKWQNAVVAQFIGKLPNFSLFHRMVNSLRGSDGLKALSHIASVIGIPLYMDQITATCKQLSYAKVCVEIGMDKEIPSSVKIVMKHGSIVPIATEVPRYPQKCKGCNIFGHNEKTCPKVKVEKVVWVHKQKDVIEVPEVAQEGA
ncbi:hypothetical protein PTKIN_Ptkin02bG0067200 [Pterospermum kingtungense]